MTERMELAVRVLVSAAKRMVNVRFPGVIPKNGVTVWLSECSLASADLADIDSMASLGVARARNAARSEGVPAASPCCGTNRWLVSMHSRNGASSRFETDMCDFDWINRAFASNFSKHLRSDLLTAIEVGFHSQILRC